MPDDVETLIKMPEIDHPKMMELYQKMGNCDMSKYTGKTD
jgi:hypothetical protein